MCVAYTCVHVIYVCTVNIAENALCSHYKEMLPVRALTFQLALELLLL